MSLTQVQVLGFKQEATPYTYETIAASEVIEKVYGTNLSIVRNKIAVPKQGALGNATGILADAYADLTTWHYMHGKGSAGVPAYATPVYESAGFSLSGATFTTSDTTTDYKPMSACHWLTPLLKKPGRGFMSNLRWTFTAGQPVREDITATGAYQADPSAEAVPTGTYESVALPRWDGATALTLDSETTFRVPEIVLDLGNVIGRVPNPNKSGGYLGGDIGNRNPTVTMTPETRSDYDWFAKFVGLNQLDMTLVVGAAANNIITVTVNDMELTTQPDDTGDREGRHTSALTFDVHGTIVIAFT